MKREYIFAPEIFWKMGDLYAIRYTLLSDYDASYAAYMNQQTKLPERIYKPDIKDVNLSEHQITKRIYEHALSRLEVVKERMLELGVL